MAAMTIGRTAPALDPTMATMPPARRARNLRDALASARLGNATAATHASVLREQYSATPGFGVPGTEGPLPPTGPGNAGGGPAP
jgi:hypothetical protein